MQIDIRPGFLKPNGYALDIWEKLRVEESVKEATEFYSGLAGSSGEDLGKKILERGSTNFDEKYTGDEHEQPYYKSSLYISCYMNMHIEQNLAVLKKYLNDLLENRQHIIFVDFGCGPMTSGLALAEILLEHDRDYKEKVTYLGVDASQNMVERAKWINKQYEIFRPNRFNVVHDTKLCAEMMTNFPFATEADLAILSLSFVLAKGTYKCPTEKDELKKRDLEFSETWDRYVSNLPNLEGLNEIRIVYLNPSVSVVTLSQSYIHANWIDFTKALSARKIGDFFSYTGGDVERITVPELQKPVMAAQMIGKKKTNRSQ